MERQWHQPDRAIVLTPPGAAAIAVVRLVGPGVRKFLREHFSREAGVDRAVHGKLADGATMLDDPVVVFDPERQIADINLHGGAWIVCAVLELARRDGFEVIERPSLPLDLLSVDATSPIEIEVLTHLPMAATELAIRVLLAQPAAWKAFQQRTASQLRAIDRILGDRSLHWLLNRPRVAIVGAANVGKSTLANQLFAQERSITADLPGTTRDWVGEIANIDGLAVMLMDTPGQRETSDSIESEAILRSSGEIERADLALLVLDASHPLEPDQLPLLPRYPQALRVVNKIDRPHAWDISSFEGIRTVATVEYGVDRLRREILSRFGCDDLSIDMPRCWTARQQEILKRAVSDISALEEL